MTLRERQEQIDRLRYRGGHDVDGRSVFNDALDLSQSLLARAEAAERERDHTQYAYEREREAKEAAERERDSWRHDALLAAEKFDAFRAATEGLARPLDDDFVTAFADSIAIWRARDALLEEDA